MDNLFVLFDSPKRDDATKRIQDAIELASNIIWEEVERHRKIGACDTASREAITKYLSDRFYQIYYERDEHLENEE